MDIGSKHGYPAGALSNFTPHPFKIDGVYCASMEGFLQSLKFENKGVQEEVCRLVGFAAKKRGSCRTKAWQRAQSLWWRGVKLDRHGEKYQELLDRAYLAMYSQSGSFRRALVASGKAVLRHSIGRTNPRETILTVSEFCGRLMRLRDRTGENTMAAVDVCPDCGGPIVHQEGCALCPVCGWSPCK